MAMTAILMIAVPVLIGAAVLIGVYMVMHRD